jgi:DNA-binding LacI/PurR family transcriptional regulator
MDLGVKDGRIKNHHMILPPYLEDAEKPENYLHTGEIQGREVAEKILQLDERPTAVVINSDHAASYTYKYLMQAGIRVPRDMSLVTYNLPDSNIPDPLRVSGIRLPFGKLGRMIPEIVQRRLTNPSAPYISVMVETDFIDHGTLSKAPLA